MGMLISTLQSFILEKTGTSFPAEHEMAAQPRTRAHGNSARDYVEIGAAFVILVGIFFILNAFDFLPQRFAVSDDMSYALVFVIGLVASISTCIAVTGGLLVAVAAKYNETTTGLTSAQRLKPHLYFNAGRIISYTLLGGAIGALGSALTLSPKINGLLTIIASAVMILLGLQMLKLLPSITRFMPAMPKAFSHRIHDFAERQTKGGAFILGAATFFLPCGFTQALQLYVLAQGGFATGALTMLAFAIGTLPALLSLSAVSSFATGAFQRRFLTFAGAAVIVLGLLNIQYGLVLASGNMDVGAVAAGPKPAPQAVEPQATTQGQKPAQQVVEQQAASEAKQIVVMRIVGYNYIPNRFTVKQGVPVEWRIDGSEAAGCGRFLLAPGLGVRRILSSNSTTTIAFTPQAAGEFGFNCGMGMMTPGSKFTVLPSERG
jgi:sulfite exporter TauE/SafE